ncbi:FHA domain-containing protein [Lysinibacillus sp. CNPSo 3705]|uniref:FHA domain-containing protein n=1 Tax=Lysinibacillus sp. CNPSo 3705 TaxID=3028148 RepID=UPI0023646A5D|nr:FHA domain-containing protein [Lysinibacillus sp. CNPSo 3705]MDD1504359.1 FHA domain-containing protein [Lysinibacillus sp. CNPSo 3705]
MYGQNSTDTYTEKAKNQMIIKVMDIIIVIITFFFILYVFVMNQNFMLKTIIGLMLVILAIVYGSVKYEARDKKDVVTNKKIRKLVLLNDRGAEIDEWEIDDQTSLLIGKSSADNKADIDLSGTEYESLINYEHAVLNNVSGVWYIEDIDSVNGVGIKKAHKRVKNRIQHENPYPIGNGDMIYIANTRILVK